MTPRTYLPAAFMLSAGLFFGIAASAADLPKDGTYNAIYTSSGNVKAIPAGKDRVLLIISDEHGQTQASGFLDRMVWLCWGTGDFIDGMGQENGHCIATDPSGDQIVDDWGSERHKIDDTKIRLIDKFTTGTGKYKGISGGGEGEIDTAFHTPEGTFAVRAPMHGTYKLQPVTQ